MRRQWIRICITVWLAVVLAAGCGKSDQPPAVPETTEAETAAAVRNDSAAPAEGIAVNENGTCTVGYVKIGAESDWRMACNRSLTDSFTQENGYYLLVSDAQQKPEKQYKAVREFINQEVDYILLDPITESGWDEVLEEAREAGIPVIVFDRDVSVKDPEAYVAWLGSDFYLEGQRACAWLETFLQEQHYEGDLNMVHIQGTLESSAQIGRTAALDEALARNANWHLLDRQPGEFTTAKGKEVMVSLLEQYGDQIQLVYCENDNEAYGAIEAIQESGRTAGLDWQNGEILVLSFDAARNALERTLAGQIAVNTECMPLYGPPLTRMIQALERGEELPRKSYVPEDQFSAVSPPEEIEVDGTSYPVTILTEELIAGRPY